MAQYGSYVVSNTSGGKANKHAIRVRQDGILLVEIFPGNGPPLQYIRTKPTSKYRAMFIAECAKKGLQEKDINDILAGTLLEHEKARISELLALNK